MPSRQILVVLYICKNAVSKQVVPYNNDSTASRLLSEVKHCLARLVLRWGTTLESREYYFFFFASPPIFIHIYTYIYLPTYPHSQLELQLSYCCSIYRPSCYSLIYPEVCYIPQDPIHSCSHRYTPWDPDTPRDPDTLTPQHTSNFFSDDTLHTITPSLAHNLIAHSSSTYEHE